MTLPLLHNHVTSWPCHSDKWWLFKMSFTDEWCFLGCNMWLEVGWRMTWTTERWGNKHRSFLDSWLENWGETSCKGSFYLRSPGNSSIQHVIHQTWDLKLFYWIFLLSFLSQYTTSKLLNDYLNRQTFDLRFMLILNPHQDIYFLGVLALGVLTEC